MLIVDCPWEKFAIPPYDISSLIPATVEEWKTQGELRNMRTHVHAQLFRRGHHTVALASCQGAVPTTGVGHIVSLIVSCRD
jgi:hypothetical protein